MEATKFVKGMKIEINGETFTVAQVSAKFVTYEEKDFTGRPHRSPTQLLAATLGNGRVRLA